VRAENEGANDIDVDPKPYFPEQEEEDEAAKLRAAEKFMVIDQGMAECSGCGYKYDQKQGDPEYPISAGITFSQLPQDWTCPICGGPQNMFQAKTKTVAGFAENQGYGLGTNSMTEDEKSILIYGALFFFFGLFLAGYAFN
jgi:rubredoxin